MGACPDRVEARELARTSIEEADKDNARIRLDQVVEAYACGRAATPDEVAELFLLEGAAASFDKDRESVEEAFQSAASVSENFWLASLGPELQDRFVEARSVLLDSGELTVEPEPLGYVVVVDGTPRTGTVYTVNQGLHLIQIGLTLEDVVFADLVSINARSRVVVDNELGPPATTDEPKLPEKEVARSALALHLGLGLGLGFGDALEGGTPMGKQEELASKVLLPLELGVHGSGARFWWRGAASVAPVLTGTLLYASEDGQAHGSKLVGGGHVAAGARISRAEIGLLTGPSWPGRWQLRAVGGGFVTGPFRVEGRLGANLVTERPLEPALEVMVSVNPRL